MWEDPYDKFYSSKKPPPSSTNIQDTYDKFYSSKEPEPKDTTTPAKSEDFFTNFLQQQPWQTGKPSPKKQAKILLGHAKTSGKRSLSLLGAIVEAEMGLIEYPILRHIMQATRVMKGKEKPSLIKFMKEGIPYASKKVRGENILEEIGMEEGWKKTALGGVIDIAADPFTYLTIGGTKAGRLAKLVEKGKMGSGVTTKVAKQIAKYERGGKILPKLGKTVEEQIQLGQRGAQFMGKPFFTEMQSKIYGKILKPIKETFLQSGLGKLTSTKYGSSEVRATHEMFMNEIHSNPEIISKIQKGMHERTKVAEQLAKKYNADPRVLDRHLNHLCNTKPPMDAPAFVGVEYNLDDMIDPAMLNTLREDQEAMKFTMDFKNEMAAMGAREVKAGVLNPSQIIETDEIDYLTHLITPEARKAINKVNRKSFSRKIVNMLHPSVQHRTLLIPTEPTNKMLSDALPRMKWADKKKLLDAGIVKYPSVAEVNKLAREGILIPGKKIEQFFYEDPAKIMAIRQLRSEQALSSARILENARDTALKEGWAKPFKGDTPEKGWGFVKSPLTNDVVFKSDAAESLNIIYEGLNSKDLPLVGQAYEKALQWWKVNTLMYFPSFHFRNVFGGNLWNQWLGGMHPIMESWFMPNGANNLAARVQKLNELNAKGISVESSKWAKFLKKTINCDTGEKYTLSKVDDMAKNFGIYRAGQFTADPFGRTSSFGRDVLGKKSKSFNPFRVHNVLTDRGMAVGSALEDNAKLGMFIWGLKKGETPAEAARIAHKFIFDYFDIPKSIERTKNVLPFITWDYKNIPLQIEYLFRKPRFAGGVYKSARAVSSGKEPPPGVESFYEKSFPVAIKKKGGKLTWFPLERWLPTADINQLDVRKPLEMAKDWASKAWPGVKAPVELLFGEDLYFGKKIAEKGKPRDVAMFGTYVPDWMAYLIRTNRLPSEIDRLNPGNIWGTETKKGLFGLGEKRAGKYEAPQKARLLRTVTGIKTYETDVRKSIDYRIGALKRNISSKRSDLKYAVSEKQKAKIKKQIREIEREIDKLQRTRY